MSVKNTSLISKSTPVAVGSYSMKNGEIATSSNSKKVTLSSQKVKEIPANFPVSVVATTTPAQLLFLPFRSTYTSPPHEATVPLTTSNTLRSAKRSNSSHSKPNSTISISIPAKPSSRTEPTHIVSSSQGSAYAQSTSRPQRMVITTQPTIASTTANALTCSSATTHHTAKAKVTITTSAVPVTKPPERVHVLHPSVSGVSAYVRKSDFLQSNAIVTQPISAAMTTTKQTVSNSTTVTLLSSRISAQPTMQSPIMLSPSSLNFNSSPSFAVPTAVTCGSGTPHVRSSINVPSTSAIMPSNQIRINSWNPLPVVMEAARVATVNSTHTASFSFTQANPVVRTVVAGSDQRVLQQSQTSVSIPHHVPNISPKPAILRRQNRVDGNVNKKLNFSSDRPVVGRMSPRKSAEHKLHAGSLDSSVAGFGFKSSFLPHESLYNKSIKPTVTGQDIKCEKDNFQTEQLISQTAGDTKLKIAPGSRTSFNIKADSASKHLAQVHTIYQPARNKLQVEDSNMLTAIASQHKLTSLERHGGQAVNSNMVHQNISDTSLNCKSPDIRLHKNFIFDPNVMTPSSGIKRKFETTNFANSDRGFAKERKIQNQESFSSKSLYLKQNPVAGLSPRKKPRKQTHVVAEELPDADRTIDYEIATEVEGEKGVSVALLDPKSDVAKPPGAKSTQPLFFSTIPANKAESFSTSSSRNLGTSSSSTEDQFTEYIDHDGVRYVAKRKRPPITLIPSNYRPRCLNNHFTYYSDVKVKEKKISLHDEQYDEKNLKGWKLVLFASQLEELALDHDALQRIEKIKEGILQHTRSFFSNGSHQCETAARLSAINATNLPSVPSTLNLSSSLHKTHFLPSDMAGFENSPLTPAERKAFQFREDMLRIEDMAQANIQRCNVIQEQLTEAKTNLLKVLDNGAIVKGVVTAARTMRKSNKSIASNGIRRPKKKRS